MNATKIFLKRRGYNISQTQSVMAFRRTVDVHGERTDLNRCGGNEYGRETTSWEAWEGMRGSNEEGIGVRWSGSLNGEEVCEWV